MVFLSLCLFLLGPLANNTSLSCVSTLFLVGYLKAGEGEKDRKI